MNKHFLIIAVVLFSNFSIQGASKKTIPYQALSVVPLCIDQLLLALPQCSDDQDQKIKAFFERYFKQHDGKLKLIVASRISDQDRQLILKIVTWVQENLKENVLATRESEFVYRYGPFEAVFWPSGIVHVGWNKEMQPEALQFFIDDSLFRAFNRDERFVPGSTKKKLIILLIAHLSLLLNLLRTSVSR